MSDMHNFYEYITEQKTNGKTVLQRVAIIIGAVVVALAALFVFTFVIPLAPLIFAVWIPLIFLVIFLWHYTQIEYEYTIVSGTMTFDLIYARRKRKRLCEAQICDMIEVAPVSDENDDSRFDPDIKKIFFACSSVSAPELYYFIYNDKENGRTLVYFDATKKAVDLMYFYNRRAVVRSDSLPH